MEEVDYDTIKQDYEAFVKHSTLDVLLPKTGDITIDTLLRKHPEDLHRTYSRAHVFFDEITTVHVILRSTLPQRLVVELLPYLDLTTSAHATNATTDAGDVGPQVSKLEIVVDKVSAADIYESVKIGTSTHIVWTRSLHITRPRARLQRPAVYLTSTLTFRADFLERTRRATKHFLQRYQSLPLNVLDSLTLSDKNDGKGLYLSEARITKVAPPSPNLDDSPKPLRGVTKRSFPAVPAIIPRLQCAAVSDKVLVNLQIEASQFVTGPITINEVDLQVTGADLSRLGIVEESPRLQAGDEMALLYRIVETKTILDAGRSGIASVAIKATVASEEGTSVVLSLAWQTQIDLSKESLTTYCSWAGEVMPQASETPRKTKQHAAITFDITAPENTKTGHDFDLTVKCVNSTERTRRFVVMVDEEANASKNAIASSPDVRIGPVDPGECSEASIGYRALVSGVLHLGQMRIIDLDCGESIKVQNLPDVVARG